MSQIAQQTSVGACSSPKSAPAAIRMVTAAYRSLCRWQTQRATLQALRGLDDRMLKDIGLTRSEVERVSIKAGFDTW